jgi:hypothetical protein
LVDDSKIKTPCKINIPLYTLKLLTTGESWYNSLGYVSKSYESEVKYNNNISNTSFMECIQNSKQTQLLQILDENTQKMYIKHKKILESQPQNESALDSISHTIVENIEYDIKTKTSDIESNSVKLLENAKIIFPDVPIQSPIREYLNIIIFSIGSKFDNLDTESCKKYKFISNLLDFINPLLQYDTLLFKYIKHNDSEPSIPKGGRKLKSRKHKKTRHRKSRRGRRRTHRK